MNRLPKVTKIILIANIAVWFTCWLVFNSFHIDLNRILGLYHPTSPLFHFWQPVTYMFMHAGFWHLFCNMFAVYMFAPALEQQWGAKRFLLYYLVSGIGAGIVQMIVWTIVGPHPLAVTVGASGAVFGILFAFGWLFPNIKMFLLFIPIPISSRIFVIIYALFELYAGLAPSAGDNVAHFAHLGGMLFGWLLILWWKHRGLSDSNAGEYDNKVGNWFRNIWYNTKRWFQHTFSRKQKSRNTYSNYHYQDPIDNRTTSSSSTNYTYSSTSTNNKAEEPVVNDEQNEEINRILDKLKQSGYASLTEEEKNQLFTNRTR